MIVYGLWAGGAFTIGVGLLPVVALAALVRPRGVPWTRELRAFVALTCRLRVASACTRRSRPLPLDGLLDGVEERNLIYLAPLLFVATGSRSSGGA